MEAGGTWAAPARVHASAPPPPPTPPPPPPAVVPSLPPPAAPVAAATLPVLPALPGGPRPEGGIVPSPLHVTDAVDGAPLVEPPPAEPVRDPDRPSFAPVTRAALGPSRNHRRLHAKSTAAIGVTALSMAASIAAAVALLQRRAGAIELRDGGDITARRLAELDDLAVFLSWVDLGVFLLAGVVGVVWFRRAYKNLKSMGRNGYTPGWAVAGWIVPIFNCFRPYQMAKELVRESPRQRGNEGTGIVGIWWLVYLTATIGSRVLAAQAQDDLDAVILNDMLRVGLHGLALIAGIAWIAIIRVVTRRQDAWFDPLPDVPVVPVVPGVPAAPSSPAGEGVAAVR